MLMEENAALLARIGTLEDAIKALSEQRAAALLQVDGLRRGSQAMREALQGFFLQHDPRFPQYERISLALDKMMTGLDGAEKPKDDHSNVPCGDGPGECSEKRKDDCLGCIEKWEFWPDARHHRLPNNRAGSLKCGRLA